MFRKGENWYLRYYDNVLLGSEAIRVQKCKKLCAALGQYKSKRAAKMLAEEFLRPFNDGTHTPESAMTLEAFVDKWYLPHVEEQKRPSTYRGYKNMWLRYLKPRTAIVLRDFRPVEGEMLLLEIARSENLCRRTLGHIKNFLSGAFSYARRIGILNTLNPMRDVPIPKARVSAETYAYSLEEIMQMLQVIPARVVAIIAAAAFTGARKGELCGFLWENYDGQQIRITQSVWRGHLGEPKTEKSRAPIPVIGPLTNFLEQHRLASGSPTTGLMFPNSLGRPMNFDTLAFETIKPALQKAGIQWHGWHAFRRGLATNLYRLGVKDKAIQAILRHSNLSTTMNAYVKSVSQDSSAAMRALEAMYATSMQPKAEMPALVLQ
jgi:integrase